MNETQQAPQQKPEGQQTQQKPQSQQKTQTQQKPQSAQNTQVTQSATAKKDLVGQLRIGSSQINPILVSEGTERIYPTLSEFIKEVDILLYESYAGELSNKEDKWSAPGIDHFAVDLGIGIVSQVISETSDGSKWIILSHGHCVADNRECCAAATQPKMVWDNKEKKMVEDPYSLEKCSRRANRNVKKQMMPIELFRAILEEAITERDEKKALENQVKAEKAALENQVKTARASAKESLTTNRPNYEKHGLNPTQLLQFAEIDNGPHLEWNVEQWDALREGVSTSETTFLQKAVEHYTDLGVLSAPEVAVTEEAEAEVTTENDTEEDLQEVEVAVEVEETTSVNLNNLDEGEQTELSERQPGEEG